jgi:transposase-like protein
MNTTEPASFPTGPARRRRRHSPEFKAGVIGACRQPGVSIAGVALANGLNANLLRRWVAEVEHRDIEAVEMASNTPSTASRTAALASFVPLQCHPDLAPADIRIEVERKGMVVKVSWPTSAASDCGAWLREVLR